MCVCLYLFSSSSCIIPGVFKIHHLTYQIHDITIINFSFDNIFKIHMLQNLFSYLCSHVFHFLKLAIESYANIVRSFENYITKIKPTKIKDLEVTTSL